jgi:hypothetical protein
VGVAISDVFDALLPQDLDHVERRGVARVVDVFFEGDAQVQRIDALRPIPPCRPLQERQAPGLR